MSTAELCIYGFVRACNIEIPQELLQLILSIYLSFVSLQELSHYFQYHANHKTNPILAHLAEIIMELVGEPNIFSIEFKIRPEIGMAIKRNGLQISPILHHRLVLSFCVCSMPQQLQHNNNDYLIESDSNYRIPPSFNTEIKENPYLYDLPSSDHNRVYTERDLFCDLNIIDNHFGIINNGSSGNHRPYFHDTMIGMQSIHNNNNDDQLPLNKRKKYVFRSTDDIFDDLLTENVYQSIIIDDRCFFSRNICMISREESTEGNILKFEKPFNKIVADENGNIFIGTNEYIRYVTYKKQEKLLYEFPSNEDLICLWNQDGNIYFTTMPYPIHLNISKYLIGECSLCLYMVYNNNDIPSNRWNSDTLQYKKLCTFRWKICGKFVEKFVSMWYDEKYDILIALAECDRHNEPKLIFINKINNGGLNKLRIRKDTFSIHGGNQLLIKHKPSKSWLCCISCYDRNNWIQFKLNRENQTITSSKIIKLPHELQRKKWLCYDKYRDCLIGIKRLETEQLLELGFETKIQLFFVPRLTKLIQQNGYNQICDMRLKNH